MMRGRHGRLGSRVSIRSRGFAFVALMIAIAIIGLASAAAASLASMTRRRDAEERLLYVGDQYRRAIEAYAAATPIGQPRYPAQLSDLLKDPRYPGTRRYLRSLTPDPITDRDDWIVIMAPEGGIMGLHSASTRLPVKRAGFDVPYETFDGRTSYTSWGFCFPACPVSSE
jgi:type II secretory pathway pseudopilin PulG